MKNWQLLVAAAAVLFTVSFKPFHHGWANYDQTKTLDYVGTVEEFTYENPHASARVKDSFHHTLGKYHFMRAPACVLGVLFKPGIVLPSAFSVQHFALSLLPIETVSLPSSFPSECPAIHR